MSVYTSSQYTQLERKWFADTEIGAYAGAYREYLTESGYADGTIASYLSCIAHFAHWNDQQQVFLADLSEVQVSNFLYKHLPVCKCAPRCRRVQTEIQAALGLLLGMLRMSGECQPRSEYLPPIIARELREFDQYLIDVRGLSLSTRLPRRRHIRDFLLDRFATGPVQMDLIKPAQVKQFMSHYTASWSPGSIKCAGISLRSYFSFRAIYGDQTTALIAALPRVAQWRLASLPPVLSHEQVDQLLHAFDRSHRTGKRDYAITRCLLDLGLRRVEVARLRLEDVDWLAGTVRIHAKGKRIDILPLPSATGQAIADYLLEGRPLTTRREIFVRHRPPLNAPAHLDVVRNAVRYAAKRCGLENQIRGTHIFRHTLAGRMVQGGARFKEIADLLRHRSLDTTTIYAKVDLPALTQVALPWPRRPQ